MMTASVLILMLGTSKGWVMEVLERSELPSDYKEMMTTESHHDHKIVMVNNVIRWKEDKDVAFFLKDISLNDLIPLLGVLGYGKNSEVYRKLYRSMGYSLSGYWEIFYWEINNDDADNYRQPEK